jgi:hypothetical protein
LINGKIGFGGGSRLASVPEICCPILSLRAALRKSASVGSFVGGLPFDGWALETPDSLTDPAFGSRGEGILRILDGTASRSGGIRKRDRCGGSRGWERESSGALSNAVKDSIMALDRCLVKSVVSK